MTVIDSLFRASTVSREDVDAGHALHRPGHGGRARALGDALAAGLVLLAATLLLPGGIAHERTVLVYIPLWLVAVALSGDYRLPGDLAVRSRRLLFVALVLPTATLLIAEMIDYPISAARVTAACVTTAVLGVGVRAGVTAIDRRLFPVAGVTHRVVVAGSSAGLPALLNRLERAQPRRFVVLGACLADDGPCSAPDVSIARGIESCAAFARTCGADAVIVAPDPNISPADVLRLRWNLEEAGIDVFVWTGLYTSPAGRTRLDLSDDLPLLYVGAPRRIGPTHWVKRLVDPVIALLALIVLSPLLLALIVAVRLDSPGPAFFRQTRVGRNDARFTMWKLRTMNTDAEAVRQALAAADEGSGVLFKIHDDPRVTRVGRWLRRTSLDELPQLFNVVLGQMSLVGPRPALPSEVEAYHPDVRHRLVVHPGITGLWQVSGRSDLSWEESVRLDQEYVDDWSLLLDLRIIVRTVGAVLRGRGAY
jgi:exopolysaccharide biosynthesis polyprenyl glycosylphosphotransferase